jgi:RNA polymerase sigma factor (sigma-70 family)
LDAARPKPDNAQFERLSTRYRVPLRRFFERRLKASPDPEDLVQEVFIRLIRQEHIGDVRNLDGYVFQVAANVLRDHARRWSIRAQELHPAALDADVLEGGFTPERVLLGQESLERLIHALHALPAKTQAIFALYHFEGVAQVDIARKLNMPLSTVEKHMGRANRHLLEYLGVAE